MATLRFAKLHGTANDFVYVDARRGLPVEPATLAPRVCDRHRGIGADGLILLLDSERAHCRMQIFNADGSTAEMCGNGIRGFAKFVLDAEQKQRGLGRDGHLDLVGHGEAAAPLPVLLGDQDAEVVAELRLLALVQAGVQRHVPLEVADPLLGERLGEELGTASSGEPGEDHGTPGKS